MGAVVSHIGRLRHLIWDNAMGLEIEAATKLGWACVIGSVVLTVLTIAIV